VVGFLFTAIYKTIKQIIMNTPVQPSESKAKKITLGGIFSWMFFLFFALAGLIALVGKPSVGVLFLLASVICLPATNSLLKKHANFSFSGGVKVLLVLVLIAISIGISAPGSYNVDSGKQADTPQAPSAPRETIKVTATQLADDYKNNEIAADAKYKGNFVEVSGVIDTIGKDIMDTPYVSLTASQYSIVGVQCMFSREDASRLAGLSKGQSVTLRGEVSSKMMNVIVRGCSVVGTK
jgi:hypothetical protein